MADPNARLIKTIEDLTSALRENNKLLKTIERNTRRVKFTNHPYVEASNDDTTEQGDFRSDTEGPDDKSQDSDPYGTISG